MRDRNSLLASRGAALALTFIVAACGGGAEPPASVDARSQGGAGSQRPKVSLAVAGSAVREDAGHATFTISLGGEPAGTVTVDYETRDGSAVAGRDYTATRGSHRFRRGEPLSLAVDVPVAADTVDEPDESFVLVATVTQGEGAVENATAEGTAVIQDDDADVLRAGAAKRSVAPSAAHIAGAEEARVYADASGNVGTQKQQFGLGGYGLSDVPNSASNPTYAHIGNGFATGNYAAVQEDGQAASTYVRALVVEQPGGAAVAFVTLDAVGAGNIIQKHLKAAVTAATGIAPENILFGQTHSHSAADLQGLWGGVPATWLDCDATPEKQALDGCGEDGWSLGLYQLAAAAVKDAYDARVPADLAVATGTVDRNRRRTLQVTPDQTTDKAMTVLQARAADGGAVIGTILQYAAHPVIIGDSSRLVHADFVLGSVTRLEHAGGGTALYYNGPIADTSPAGTDGRACAPEENSGTAHSYCRARSYGEDLADAALDLLQTRAQAVAPTLTADSREATLPVTNPAFLAAGVGRMFNRYYNFIETPVDDVPEVAMFRNELPQVAPFATTTVSRITLGNPAQDAGLEIVTIPGEGRNALGQLIRHLAYGDAKASKPMMLLGLTHNSFGYIIPEEEFGGAFHQGEVYEEIVSLGPLTAPLLRLQAYFPLFGVPTEAYAPHYVTECQQSQDSDACMLQILEYRLGQPNPLTDGLDTALDALADGCRSALGGTPLEALCAAPDALAGLFDDGLPTPDGGGSVGPELVAALADAQLRGCDVLDPSECLLPFPSDHFTVPAAAGSPQGVDAGGTGKRINLNVLAMPRNAAGRPIDPTEWNRNDGYSPGQLIVTYVPGIGTVKGADGRPRGPVTGAVPLTDLPRYADADAPILVLDAATGERHPIWAEINLDAGYLLPMQGFGPREAKPALLIRPAKNFLEGHRYVVVLRSLEDDAGAPIRAQAPFQLCRDGDSALRQVPVLNARCEALEQGVFPVLEDAGIARDDSLYLAWDFTVASAHNDIGRLKAMRDDAFGNYLGEGADAPVPGEPGYPAGRAPHYQVIEVIENPDGPGGKTVRRIRGSLTVPSYVVPADPSPLDANTDFIAFRETLRENNADALEAIRQQCSSSPVDDADPVGLLCDLFDPNTAASASLPPNRLHYLPDASSSEVCEPDPAQVAGGCALQARYGDGLPDRNPAGDLTTTFTCNIPRSAVAGAADMASATAADVRTARPTLYGHGLLGGHGEGNGQASDFGNRYGFMTCMTDWFGFASGDVPNVASALVDLSNFQVVPDGTQQGILNQLFLARLAVHPQGLAADPLFQVQGRPVFDRREVFYHGNSQGGIVGGAVVAASKDVNRGVLGVPGMNYSTLLSRSTDFGIYSIPLYLSYQGELERPFIMSLMQMLWDRSENNGYAAHITDNAAFGGPDNAVLLHPAYGDHQVTMWTTDVMARTLGARVDRQRVSEERMHAAGFPLGASGEVMLPRMDYADPDQAGGSALVYFDQDWLTANDRRCSAGTRTAPPPIGNVPPNRAVLLGAGPPLEDDAAAFDTDAGADPHECPRRDPQARCQASNFLQRAGVLVDPAIASSEVDDTSAGCPAVIITDAPGAGEPAAPEDPLAVVMACLDQPAGPGCPLSEVLAPIDEQVDPLPGQCRAYAGPAGAACVLADAAANALENDTLPPPGGFENASCVAQRKLGGDDSYHVVIEAEDGERISFQVLEPAQFDCAAGHPLILQGHGFGGSRSRSGFGEYRGAGYAVISIDQRGFGQSSGTVRVMDPDAEGRNLVRILDWAERNLDYLAYREGNLLAGAMGGSYGGGFQFLLHNVDPKGRLDALAPDITWHDLRYSLNPGDALKSAFGLLLTAGGENGSYTPGVANADEPNRRGIDPYIKEVLARALATGEFPREALEWFRYHSPTYWCDLNEQPAMPYAARANAPVDPNAMIGTLRGDLPGANRGTGQGPVDILISQGFRDTLFNFNDAWWNYQCARVRGGDVRLLTHQSGHILDPRGLVSSSIPRGTPLDVQAPGGSGNCGGTSRSAGATVAWFDEKLRGVNSANLDATDDARLCLSLADGDAVYVPEHNLLAPRAARFTEILAQPPEVAYTVVEGVALGAVPHGAAAQAQFAAQQAQGYAESAPQAIADPSPTAQREIPAVAPLFTVTDAAGLIVAGIAQGDVTLATPAGANDAACAAGLDAPTARTGCDAVVFVGLGVKRAGTDAWLPIDDQITPVRGLGAHAAVAFAGVAERLAQGDQLGLLVYGYHRQYLGSWSRDATLPVVDVSAKLSLPLYAVASDATPDFARDAATAVEPVQGGGEPEPDTETGHGLAGCVTGQDPALCQAALESLTGLQDCSFDESGINCAYEIVADAIGVDTASTFLQGLFEQCAASPAAPACGAIASTADGTDAASLAVASRPIPRGDLAYAEQPAVPPSAKTVDGAIGDWMAQGTRVGGTALYEFGEHVYTDFLFDAFGADDGDDARRWATLALLGEASSRTERIDALQQAGGDQLDVPQPVGTSSDHYGDATAREDGTDLTEVRWAADAADLYLLARVSKLQSAANLVVMVLADTDDTSGSLGLPAGLGTHMFDRAVLLRDGAGQVLNLATGAAVNLAAAGGEARASAADYDNALEARLPRALLERPDGTLRVAVMTLRAADLVPANVAYRFDEPVTIFNERAQALGLFAGSVDAFATDISVAGLVAGRTQGAHPGFGYHERQFVSGANISFEADTENGRLQPYGVFVPSRPAVNALNQARMTIWTHYRGGKAHSGASWTPRLFWQLGEEQGNLVVSPRGRGTSTWYTTRAHQDFFEVFADVAGTAILKQYAQENLPAGHGFAADGLFSVDPARVYISGYSMGGYATYLFGGLYPDLFAAGYSTSGAVTQGAWTGLGPEPGEPGAEACGYAAPDDVPEVGGGTPCFIEANSGRANAQLNYRILENTRHVPLAIHHGTNDELALTPGAVRMGEKLATLRYRYDMLMFLGYEHFTQAIMDEWRDGAHYLNLFARPENPRVVTYQVVPALVKAVNEAQLNGVNGNQPFTFHPDGAYWVDGLVVRDGADGAIVEGEPMPSGRIDAVSGRIAGPDYVAVPRSGADVPGDPAGAYVSTPAYSPGNHSTPYARHGTDWVTVGELAGDANSFTADLVNLSRATLDLPRMGFAGHFDEPIEGEVYSDGAAQLTLARVGADMTACVNGAAVGDVPRDGDAVVALAAGDSVVRLVPGLGADCGGSGTPATEPNLESCYTHPQHEQCVLKPLADLLSENQRHACFTQGFADAGCPLSAVVQPLQDNDPTGAAATLVGVLSDVVGCAVRPGSPFCQFSEEDCDIDPTGQACAVRDVLAAIYDLNGQLGLPLTGPHAGDTPCDQYAGDPEPGTPAWQQRDLVNVICAAQRMSDEYANPDFMLALAARSTPRTYTYNLLEQAADPTRPRLTLAQWIPGGRSTDPFRVDEDWAAAGRGRVTHVGFIAESGARLVGRVFRPPASVPSPYPAIVITTGSIQGYQEMYNWAAEGLAEAGYLVFTYDVQGQGRSETLPHAADGTPSASMQGVPFQQAYNFEQGTRDALRWLLSTADAPYAAPDANNAGTELYNPHADEVDRSALGLAGHSLGASAVSLVGQEQACEPGTPRLLRRDCVSAIVAWDALAARGPALKAPGLSLTAEYFLNPAPASSAPNGESGTAAFNSFVAAGVDSMRVSLRSSTHLEWTYVPLILPASRYGERASMHYTLAWFDRYVRDDRAATQRLTATHFDASADASSIGAGTYDPVSGNNVPYRIAGRCVSDHTSIYYRSAYFLEGGAEQEPDLRARGCAGVAAAFSPDPTGSADRDANGAGAQQTVAGDEGPLVDLLADASAAITSFVHDLVNDPASAGDGADDAADTRAVSAGAFAGTGYVAGPEEGNCAPDNAAAASYVALRGSLHEHSGYSDGTPGTEPRDYFAAGKAHGLDFVGSSEHSDNADIPPTVTDACLDFETFPQCLVADNDNPADAFRKWDATLEQARAASDAGFTAFRGFEWTSDRFGHINVFFSRHDWNAKTTDGYAVSMESFWRWFTTRPELGGGADSLGVFNHPGREDQVESNAPNLDPAYAFNDFEYRPEADLRMVGVETFGKGGDAYDADNNAPAGGWYAYALDKGWHVGPVGAEDEHGTNWAQPARAKTILVARDHSEGALREALFARRFYALSQHHNDLRLTFTADGQPMGSRLARAAGAKVLLSGRVTAGVAAVDHVDLVTAGGTVLATHPGPVITARVAAETAERWYYFRAMGADGRPIAYSAPVWIRAGGAYPLCGEWLAGDLHVHTTYSHDSYGGPDDDNTGPEEAYVLGHSVENQFRIASARGLDYLAITDHNDVRSQSDPGFGAFGVLPLRSYENSLSGHAQMHGAGRIYDAGDKSAAAIDAMAGALRADGGVFQINHPADGPGLYPDNLGWRYGYAVVPDTVEVWNIGPRYYQKPAPSNTNNDDSTRYWEGWLDRGYRVAATGGSDNHWVSTTAVQGNGQPTTWIFATERSERGLLEGLRANRTAIAHQPPLLNAPHLVIEADADGDGIFEAMTGGVVPAGAALRVRARDAGGALLRIHAAGGFVTEAPVAVVTPVFEYRFTLPPGARWVRAEVAAADARDQRQSFDGACANTAVLGDNGFPEDTGTTYCRNQLAVLAMTSALYLQIP